MTGASSAAPGAGQHNSLLEGGPVAAVLFDYGLTLVHFERPVEAIDAAQQAVADLVEAAGHPRPTMAALRAQVHARVEAEVAAHEASGALEEIDVALLEQRAFAAIGLRLEADLLDRCSVVVQEAWWRGVRLYPDVVDALRTLRSGGLRVGLCSNAPYRPASMHDQLTHVGLDSLLDATVFSGEVGWRKPSPRLFEAALRALGTTAAQTVFVGDRVREDIGGATDAGMRTVLIARQGSLAQPVPSGHPATTLIRSLTELPALLLGDSQL